MSGDYTMMAICASAIPVLQYMLGIMKWMKGELQKIDVKTQKMLTMKSVHPPKGNAHPLYLHRSKGRRGITGFEDTHNCECAALAEDVLNSTDSLHLDSAQHNDNLLQCLKEKPLHGKFFRQQEEIPQVDLTQLHQWFCCTQLCPETEAAICAAQEQTM
eukprot:12092133-Ditylum_brightwellii.AAC.1